MLNYRQNNQNEELFVEDVALSDLAKKYGTPAYVYSKKGILENFRNFSGAFSELPHLICVSVKANGNLSLLSLLAKEKNCGFDVVSYGEYLRGVKASARKAQNPIVFSGVGKTDEEINFALSSGVLFLNVESRQELEKINQLAKAAGKKAPVALRVNPDVDAKTHPYISTGMFEHKFGIALPEAKEIYQEAAQYSNVDFVGVDCHIGSSINDPNAFEEAFSKLSKFTEEVRKYVPTLKYVDLGGGVGVKYKDEKALELGVYAQIVKKHFANSGLTLVFEPGRWIFANNGLIISKVIFTKQNTKKNFLIIDAAFNDLMRPTLYQAYHEILPVRKNAQTQNIAQDIVGPICESGDCFAKGRELPGLESEELVAICSAGAYGFSMASNYNTRPRPVELLVDGKEVKVIRPREVVEDLLALEVSCL